MGRAQVSIEILLMQDAQCYRQTMYVALSVLQCFVGSPTKH